MLASATELARYLADNPGAVIETVASERDVTARAVVEALPAEMRRFAPGDAFVRGDGGFGQMGRRDSDRAYRRRHHGVHRSDPERAGGARLYNLMGSTGFHGHIRHERCAGLAFVERPFMGKSSAFVAFFNTSAFSKSGLPVLRRTRALTF
jgi:heme iron utilization protein